MGELWWLIRNCPASWIVTAIAEFIMVVYLIIQLWYLFF